MPTVRKQTARRRKKSSSAVDRIAPVSSDNRGFKGNFYGRSGTGKTTLACTFQKPLLLIGAEDGMQSVRDVKGVDFVQIYSPEEFTEVVEHFSSSRYKTGVLDTLGTLYDLQLRAILGIEELPETRSWGMADRGQWQQCNTQIIERLRTFLDLYKEGQNVIVLAQEREFNLEEDRGELIMPFVASATTPGVVGWLNPACDYLCQTFIRQRETEKTTTIGKKIITRKVKTKGVEYCLRTAPDPVFTTKFRLPKGTKLPDVIVDPDFDKINQLIQGG